MLGFLLVDKPAGVTSHDVVSIARRSLGIRRIGHAGTLDPMATGLLFLGVGKATRLLPFAVLEPKVYEGSFVLGESTTTQDRFGEVLQQVDATGISFEVIRECAQGFVGTIEQIPPMYSAVKVSGKRLYVAARRGETVERESRCVRVHAFEILECSALSEKLECTFRVVCGGGTYVRTLVHDLGSRLGVGGHLTSLRRHALGPFGVASAVPVDDITPSRLMPVEEALSHIPTLSLDAHQAALVCRGGAVSLPWHQPGCALMMAGGELVALAEYLDGRWWPKVVLTD